MITHDERALRIVKHFRLCMTNLGAFTGLLVGLFLSVAGAPIWLWLVFLVMEGWRTVWHHRKWVRD